MDIIKKYGCLLLVYIFHLFPIKKNKVFLYSYYGSQYGCNPKYITEYILQQTPKGKYDLVWALNDLKNSDIRHGIRKVKTMSIRYFYEMCTAKVIITNFRTTDFFIKRKNQYYIQTWHSSLRLKRIEKDAIKYLPKQYVEMAKKDSGKCDLLLSGCGYSTEIFRRSFWYDGEIFTHGTPRNDVFFQKGIVDKDKLLYQLNIERGTKIVLYAPTFRKNNDLTVYNLDYKALVKALKKKFGGNWICLIKLHPHLLPYSQQLRSAAGDVKDVTSFHDIQQLLYITDFLITDYSSLMFDYSITNKPCYLYVPDEMEYMKKERELYFKLSEIPFIKAYSNQDLSEKIQQLDLVQYQKSLKSFHHRIGSYETGRACEKLLNRIEEICFEESGRDTVEAI